MHSCNVILGTFSQPGCPIALHSNRLSRNASRSIRHVDILLHTDSITLVMRIVEVSYTKIYTSCELLYFYDVKIPAYILHFFSPCCYNWELVRASSRKILE